MKHIFIICSKYENKMKYYCHLQDFHNFIPWKKEWNNFQIGNLKKIKYVYVKLGHYFSQIASFGGNIIGHCQHVNNGIECVSVLKRHTKGYTVCPNKNYNRTFRINNFKSLKWIKVRFPVMKI